MASHSLRGHYESYKVASSGLMIIHSFIPFDSHKILKLAEKMKWDEAIIDGSSKVQNYLLNAIMVIEKKISLRTGFSFEGFFM